MTNAQKRSAVRALYVNRRWAQRVDRMSDSQILGIYKSRIENKTKPEEKK